MVAANRVAEGRRFRRVRGVAEPAPPRRAVRQALDDANWHPADPDDQAATGVLLGSGIGGVGGIAETTFSFGSKSVSTGAYVVKFDPTGTPLWTKSLGGSYGCSFFLSTTIFVATTPQDDVAVGGTAAVRNTAPRPVVTEQPMSAARSRGMSSRIFTSAFSWMSMFSAKLDRCRN